MKLDISQPLPTSTPKPILTVALVVPLLTDSRSTTLIQLIEIKAADFLRTPVITKPSFHFPSMSEPSKSDGPKKPDPEKEEIDVSARHGKGAKDPFDLSPESIKDSK